MAGKLVPELHDIGKLVDNEAVNNDLPGLGLEHHYFTTGDQTDIIDWKTWGITIPHTLTWLGIIGHSSRFIAKGTAIGTPPGKLKEIGVPIGPEEMAKLLLLVIADHLASSTSRVIYEDEGLYIRKSIATLWNSGVETAYTGLPIANRTELAELLKWLATDPEANQYFDRFGKHLSTIPEDKDVARSLTSLATHSMLVGKFFRILTNSLAVNPKKTRLVYRGMDYINCRDIEEKCLFRLVRCNIAFPQRLVRIHDLGVFLRLQDLMREVEKDDHVLLHTLDSLLLFLPVEDISPVRNTIKPFLDAGFIIEGEVAEALLRDLSSDIFEKQKSRLPTIRWQPAMPSELAPPLCELCQMKKAIPEPVVDEESGIKEFLCSNCKDLRDQAKNKGRFNKLGGPWEKLDLPVAWIRLNLDYKHLHELLKSLFESYLEGLPAKDGKFLSTEQIQSLVQELRDIALMVDFTSDYNRLLARFSDRLKQEIGEENIEEIIGERPELLAVALTKEGQAFSIADIFIQEFCQLFPACEKDSPVSVTVSIANAKYPFSEHWAYLHHPKEAVNVQLAGKTTLELSIPRFRKLRQMELEKASSKLHRAMAMGTRTGSALMQKIEFLEDLPRYRQLHKAHIQENFSVNQLLSYYKISRAGGQP